jgi:glycosyltransferase involved in cell wall biosynthesis
VRVLIVTNMYPSEARPALGSFVRDQVEALRRLSDAPDVDVFAFDPGGVGAYLRAAREIRRRYRGERFDVVHAHFGLTAWPALAARAGVHGVTLHGTDLAHPRSRPITLAALRLLDLVVAVSAPLAATVPGWATLSPVEVVPVGVELKRLHPIDRGDARRALGLDPEGPYLLFPADPARPEKRHDLALQVAGDTPLLTLGSVSPAEVRLWVNAANAVLVPSDREGFGLAVLEALACDVPVIATPVGVHADALAGIDGCHCGPFELPTWQTAVAPHLAADDPRVRGRERAEQYSTDAMAKKLVQTWDSRLRGRGRRLYSPQRRAL